MKLFIGVYILMLLVVFILPFFSVESYSILANTTSHLGAQESPNGWIMNLTFILLGISTIYAGWESLNHNWFQKAILLIFGIALILTGIFKHAPIEGGLSYNIREDYWHALFSSVTGFTFTVFAASMAFVLKKKYDKALAVLMAVSGVVLPILMFTDPEWMGIWQRIIFISSFGWMIHVFSVERKEVYININQLHHVQKPQRIIR